ncbi:MAG TPA: prepilin-type N-terminal cleavage/methylation domain-containing protein [Myxococcaceae bacterium]|jgi:general secretion pathway protein I
MMRRRAGFTLLETMVAMAILAGSLMAIARLNSGSVAMHAYTKKVTVATLLARSKMTDLEQELYDKGFSADDDEQSGDFSAEGFSSFKWRAKILAPRTSGVSTDQLLAAVFNIPVGGGGDGQDGLSAISSLFGGASGSPPGGDGKGGPAGAGGAGALAGMAGGLAQAQMTQFLDQIAKTVREVHLTVTWRDGTIVESVDLVTHVVSLGPGSDRNGAPGPATNPGSGFIPPRGPTPQPGQPPPGQQR